MCVQYSSPVLGEVPIGRRGFQFSTFNLKMGLLVFLLMMLLIPTLFVLVFILNLVFRVRNATRNVFGRKPQQEQYQQQRPRYDYDESDNPIEEEIREEINERRQRGEKIIADNEGEYVDYEEVK